MAAIPRFGTRVVPEMRQIIDECRAHKQLVEGPCTDQFEQEFARFLGSGHVRTCSTEYGRMALYFILKAMAFPPGSEIIVPALTFWVVPEIARVAGLKVVFADIDPATFGLSPAAVERAITPNTRAVLPTHLYGMACEMDPILELARRYQLKVIEDCAHSLGATYKGRLVGTLGDASFFSFQAFKPLNTYGGGLAWMRDADLAQRVGALAAAEDWPTEKRVEGILRTGYWQHTFIRPKVFTYSLFPIWYAASWVDAKPEERLWEGVRSLDPIPAHYRGRFTNVQAAIGLAGLKRLPEFIHRTRRHARMLDALLGDVAGITIPQIPPDRTHVYYQYCAYVPASDTIVKRCIRRGVDVAPMHVDICTRLNLFGWTGPAAIGAETAATAVQVPVYESLSDEEIDRVGRLVRTQVQRLSNAPKTTAPTMAARSHRSAG
jgi:dTDP-4-amino-4,6-dideoxygalactose transaminase